jgi:c-di-GMP-binding flagellar brake protein YcgR
MESERRRHPRFPIIADAEVTEITSDTKLSAKTSDLSAGGCFLDMLNPSPEGTEIAVRISHADATFTARGKVVFVFPNMGMGVMFTDVPASQQAILQKWLEKLTAGEG